MTLLKIAVSWAIALFVALGCSHAAEPQIKREPQPKQKAPTDYAAVVAQLVSPNKEAQTYNQADSWVKFPAGYDKEAQEKINTARKQLQDNFEAALPHLVAALDDQRYCMTINWAEGDGYYNESVGAICKNIIASQLEVYRKKLHFDLPRWHRYNFPVSKEWYAKHQGQSLVELQLDAIDWAIEKRKAEGDVQIFRENETELAELTKLREELKQSGQPLKPSGMLRMTTRDADH